MIFVVLEHGFHSGLILETLDHGYVKLISVTS